MASILADYVIDNGLTKLDTEADHIYVCSNTDPTTYTEATSTYALGNKSFSAGGAVGSPAAGSPNGRKVSTTAITDGAVTGTGSTTKWAITDNANTRLLVNGALSSSVPVVSGNAFALSSFDVRIPNQ